MSLLPRWLQRWIYERRDGRRTVWVRISNLTEPQVQALESLFQQWVELGSMGASRWTAFYADGDGNFRPRITVNGHRPRFSPYLTDAWKGHELRIDFDSIAWKMHASAPSTPEHSRDPE